MVVLAGCGRLGFDPSAGAGDASIDGNLDAPGCTALFCDGFEDPALTVWGVMLANGSSANRDPAFGFRGASLHAIAPNGSDIAARFVSVFAPSPPADQWVRAYVFAPSTATLDVEPIEMADVAQASHIVFALYDDSVDIHAHGIAGNFLKMGPASPPPRDRWVCYELHVAIGAAGAVELYGDSALVVAQTGIDTRPSMDLSRVLVGMPSKSPMVAGDLFIDEVAADTKRTGCL